MYISIYIYIYIGIINQIISYLLYRNGLILIRLQIKIYRIICFMYIFFIGFNNLKIVVLIVLNYLIKVLVENIIQ